MAKTISLKLTKASTDKPSINPLPGHKTLGIEPAIIFYEIEYGDNKKEGE